MQVNATFKPTSWDEPTIDTISKDQLITRVSATYTFSGEITGEASVEYVMYYRHKDANDPHAGSAVYAGLQRLKVTLGGKSGSFMLEDRGTFEGRAAKSELRIIEGSGTGDLAGITGTGNYEASPTAAGFTLDYSL